MIYIFLSIVLCAQPLTAAEKQHVPLIATHGELPHAWYSEQKQLWQQETERAPTSAEAWRNYYMASEYSQRRASKDEDALDAILAAMQHRVADSYEYAQLRFRNTSWSDIDEKTARAELAYQRCQTCGEIVQDLAFLYEITGQAERAQPLWTTLYQTQYLASGLLDYNYNMLMSTAPAALLLTNGDNDTYPALLLQSLHAVRTDVLVLNLYLVEHQRAQQQSLLKNEEIEVDLSALPRGDSAAFAAALVGALATKAPQRPVYFALSTSAAYKEQLNEYLYIEGLAARYSTKGVDHLGYLSDHIENQFRLDSLTQNWYAESHPSTHSVVERLNSNYAFPFILLAEHYDARGEKTRAERWRERAFDVARIDPYLLEKLQQRTEN